MSNLGRVKSLKSNKERILKTPFLRNYHCVSLHKNCNLFFYKVHQLMAMAFLKHKLCGNRIVVDHVDNNPKNNILSNIQLISHRKNLSKNKTGSSKYTGVYWEARREKWKSQIRINGKVKHLGSFKDEYKAHLAYQKALKELT